MPAAKPPEFRRRAVELARLREKPIAEIARDLGISESCLRRWMDQADVDEAAEGGRPDVRAEFGDRLPVVLLDGDEHSYWEVDEPRLRDDLAARR